MRFRNLMMIAIAGLLTASCGRSTPAESTRAERKHILEGNELYGKGNFAGAMGSYNTALEERPGSVEARYNLGLSQLRRSQTLEADSLKQAFMQTALENTREVTRHGADKPLVASRANYNLGNVTFGNEDYAGAIEQYKQALRLNPDDEAARRNLRIAQLKKQEQDDNKDDNKDQDQNKDQQDQNKDQQDQNRDQQQNQNQQQNPDQQPPKPEEQEINPQTSDQILKAMENKENSTRARVMKGQNGQEAAGSARHRKNW